MNTTINKSANGHMYKCSSCSKVHIEFNNLLFSFTDDEYTIFRKCLLHIDGAYYEHMNARMFYKRKILVPVGHQNITMLLNRSELAELKQLLVLDPLNNEANIYISCTEIGIKLSSN